MKLHEGDRVMIHERWHAIDWFGLTSRDALHPSWTYYERVFDRSTIRFGDIDCVMEQLMAEGTWRAAVS